MASSPELNPSADSFADLSHVLGGELAAFCPRQGPRFTSRSWQRLAFLHRPAAPFPFGGLGLLFTSPGLSGSSP